VGSITDIHIKTHSACRVVVLFILRKLKVERLSLWKPFRFFFVIGLQVFVIVRCRLGIILLLFL